MQVVQLAPPYLSSSSREEADGHAPLADACVPSTPPVQISRYLPSGGVVRASRRRDRSRLEILSRALTYKRILRSRHFSSPDKLVAPSFNTRRGLVSQIRLVSRAKRLFAPCTERVFDMRKVSFCTARPSV